MLYTISLKIKFLLFDGREDELRELSNIKHCWGRCSGADNWLIMQLCDVAGASVVIWSKSNRENNSITSLSVNYGARLRGWAMQRERLPVLITSRRSTLVERAWSWFEILGKIMMRSFFTNPFRSARIRLLYVIDFPSSPSRMWISNEINGLRRSVSGITESSVKYASNVMSLSPE